MMIIEIDLLIIIMRLIIIVLDII